MSLTDYEMLQNEVADQQQEIAELKSLAAYAEQRANMLTKANEALKAKLQSVKSDLIKTIISDINIGYAHCELNCDDILDYLNGEFKKVSEGKS